MRKNTLLTDSSEVREPDQDIVDEIGRAVGVTYEEGEPVRVGEKEHERDEHRWELNPASAEDFGSRSFESERTPTLPSLELGVEMSLPRQPAGSINTHDQP